jgi:hypothetical protein
MKPEWILAVAVSCCGVSAAIGAAASRAHSATAATPSDDQHSAELFMQMAPVLQSPRCMNCHTSTDFPRQGDDRHRHLMLVVRGPHDHGSPALHCQTCHHDTNNTETGVPGAPDWRLAPLSMAWEGLSAAQICQVMFDPKRGGLQPDKFVAHIETPLVQWAWDPGTDLDGHTRATPPVPRDEFLQLAREWVLSGTKCP